ncbi:MAG: RHS repeat-associated core domain-containing protein [Bacteroidia bacterium]|nr:RHS repeat-associated core domain-containing protein [Bacteroidia bacterium]
MDAANDGTTDYFTGEVLSANDYYAFGATMPGRSFTSSSYRYGFNGKENDPEGMGGGGSTYDYGFRIYNPNLGRFLSVDPLTDSYPWYTPYQFAGNKVIEAIDLDGLEEFKVREKKSGNKWILTIDHTNIEGEKNTFQEIDDNNKPVGVVKPITKEMEWYVDRARSYKTTENKNGAVFSIDQPLITKTNAEEIDKKKERSTTETKADTKINGNPIVKDPEPPPAFSNSVVGEIFIENGKEYEHGFTLGKDFKNMATEIAIYLLKNPKANLTITLSGGYVRPGGDLGKSWNDPIVYGTYKGLTYAERFALEYKAVVNTVIKLTNGKVDASRMSAKQGSLEGTEFDVTPTSNEKKP